MRSLVVLRGCPGSGKSTWVEQNGLEPYTLSPDKIRNMACTPVYTESSSNELCTSQQNESYVWSLLYELLEKRMQNGDFTIIDATHSKSTDFSRYNSMCATYRYRKYVVSFTYVPKEVCKERNKLRESYKKVPEDVIDKMYARFSTQDKTSGWIDIPRDKFWDTIQNQVYDFNEYNKIHVFGDIHGCYNPLMRYILKSSVLTFEDRYYTPEELSNYINDNDCYIFTGDYLDRGLQNKEVLQFISLIYEKRNVLLLEGNHERNLWYWANEQDNLIKSKEFINNTASQIRSIPEKDIRQIYRKLGQMAYITFNGKEYFINHGGLSCLPKYIQLVSTNQLINGVGRFIYNVDEEYTKNSGDTNVIQIHGHRNIQNGDTEQNNMSISLEDRVEFGGNLVVLEINREDNKIHKISNDLFREPEEEEKQDTNVRQEELTLDNVLYRMRLNKNIRENILDNSVSSFNFTRHAFEKGKWDKETIKARGLFIDTQSNKIVARGYEKFFNINEQESSKLFNLKTLFDTGLPVVAYKKYNGFLGILSYYNDQLQFHSKSTNTGEFAQYFKDLFYKQYSDTQIEQITDYLKENDVSITYEVIDLENDPHIIDEKTSRVVMLDVIYNTLNFKRLPYTELCKFAEQLNLEDTQYKQVYTTFTSYRELTEFYDIHKKDDNFEDVYIEGVVIECGEFMTKLKFNYYTFWKGMREVSRLVQSNSPVKLTRLYNDTANYFYKFVKDKQDNRIEQYIDIKNKLSDYNLTLQDVKRCYINKEDNTLTIYGDYKERQGSTIIKVDGQIVSQLSELRKQWDIITLRKQYIEYMNKQQD